MSKDILAQVVTDLISSQTKFSLQLDTTTDVFNLSQAAVFVRYVKDDVINEDSLFCKPLRTTTKAAHVKKLVDNSFKNKSFVVYGFCSLFRWSSNHAGKKVWFWLPLWFEAKTLPQKLAEVLKIVVECVNYVRTSVLRHRIFSELCKEMGFEFEVLQYLGGYPGGYPGDRC
ncbi:hypothetical protein FHG87_024037 [Trinorchestia longiramus]|nr:hypothetical protein FHG87_024037 [Trinorchestia longiramus]